ncbi:MAG: transglycosylase domain-containing protein [Myxococcota bacterium]
MRKWLAGTLAALGLSAAGCGWSYQSYVVDDPGPQFTREAILAIIAQESPVYYRDGATRIGVFFDVEHRSYVPFDRIPKDFVNAIVAAEDGAFFDHPGVSPKHIVRAAWQNVKAGRVVAGGSTLTQQTAKNLFYRPDRSFRSKATELVNALRLEAHFSKEDILEFYANQFHVSANGRGLGIAARYFFDKDVSALTLKECAFVAGMVKAPTRYNPFIGETEARRAAARAAAEERTAYVLRRMVEEGSLEDVELDALLAEPLAFRRGAFQYDRSVLLDEVQRRLEEPAFIELFERLEIDNPSTAGIQIITTVDARAQTGATYALWHHLTELGPLLERSTATALRLPDKTPVPMDAGHPLETHAFYAAKVAGTGEPMTLDVGGRPCTVVGLDRIATVLTRARTGDMYDAADAAAYEAIRKALPVGAVVLASVKAPGECELEIRPRLQGAVVVLEDGQVRALVGGNDNRNFNRVTTAKRQFGSTWKPLVYLAATHLGWLPTDVLDNRRAVFPFRDVWYYPRPDHASDPWITMSFAGARSENLASVWLLAHLTDRLNPEQLRQLATLVGLAKRPDEGGEAWLVRMRDEEGLRSSPDRFEEYAFTLAREDVLSGVAFLPHPEDAASLRSMAHGRGFAAERARLLRTSATPERAARLSALGNNLLDLERLAGECATGATPLWLAPEGEVRCGDAPADFVPAPATDDFLVDGRTHASTLRELRSALDRRAGELAGRDPWDPEVVALHPDWRTLVGVRYVTRLAAAFGVEAELPDVLSLPLGAADISLLEAASLYQGFLRGERWAHESEGFDEGAVPGLRSAFDLGVTDSPMLIAEIRDAAGNVLYRAEPVARAVADPIAGELVGDVLRNVVDAGTGRRAAGAVKVGGSPVPLAGKTGTTNDYRNAAFVGFAPRASAGPPRWGDAFTVAAYVGYDDNQSMRRGALRVQGANGALPVWLGAVQALADAGQLGAAGGWVPHDGLVASPATPGTGLPRSGGDGPTVLTPADGARRFAPFTEAPLPAEAGTPLPAPPADPVVGADLGPTAIEEGVEPPAPAPVAAEPSVWDRIEGAPP